MALLRCNIDAVLPTPPDLICVRAQPLRTLRAILRRIDGWGPLAWRELRGGWDLGGATLVIEPNDDDPDDPMLINALLIVEHGYGSGDPVAITDWIMRQAWAGWLQHSEIMVSTVRPGAVVRATSSAWIAEGKFLWRGSSRLPMQGMAIASAPVLRWIEQLRTWTDQISHGQQRRQMRAWCRSIAFTRALRAALPGHGLCAFLGEGSHLARDRADRPTGEPLRIPADLAIIIDCPGHGKIRGWGVRSGSTALIGAPYHGKSTVLSAIAAGIHDHPLGDGRERVVSLATACVIPADEGRRIKATDLSSWFRTLPGGDSHAFTSERASGATSQAAGIEQAIAAGSRLLLIDEDTAAANALSLDPAMRTLLGEDGIGTSTLAELMPALSAQGISLITVVGSSSALAAAAQHIVFMHDYQPCEYTVQARRVLGPLPAVVPWIIPQRLVADAAEVLFQRRHFIAVSGAPDRPIINGITIDLRRCGYDLDRATVAAAAAAAAWVCRLGGGQPAELAALLDQVEAWLDHCGVRALNPYGAAHLIRPPRGLIAVLLERLPRPWIIPPNMPDPSEVVQPLAVADDPLTSRPRHASGRNKIRRAGD